MMNLQRFAYSIIPEQRRSAEISDCENRLLSHEENADANSAPQPEVKFSSVIKSTSIYRSYSSNIFKFFHITLTVLLAFIVVVIFIMRRSMSSLDPQITYSPAQGAIRYTTRLFDSGLNYGKTKYQGPPSQKNNDAWTALFIHGLTQISAAEAAPMHNKTLPIPDDPENYITSLAGFHQLHCLNAIRMALWNTSLMRGEEDETNMRHLDHCVDMIRQAIMCHSDISPFVWARDPRDGKAEGISSVTHTCRDFNAIQQWAADRPFVTGFNTSKVITGDPLGWADYQVSLDYGEVTEWEKQKSDYRA